MKVSNIVLQDLDHLKYKHFNSTWNDINQCLVYKVCFLLLKGGVIL